MALGITSFYSKLVRLKVTRGMSLQHYGSRFYSKLVRLKVRMVLQKAIRDVCFYSKLVRLKGFEEISASEAMKEFLFQTGSIKSGTQRAWSSSVSGFYSKLVRLKVSWRIPVLSIFVVSIPNWFD